jgi:hypothetical protein
MEIHHHPKHSKKPREWKEYLFEFLVIFVAITGSFFAENLREHFTDKHNSKEYMERLLQDLKADTTNLARTIAQNHYLIKGLDSLAEIMKDPQINNKLLQFYNLNQNYATKYYGFNPVTTTMTQLMSTGSLRLIKERAVSDGIINYDKAKNDILQIGEFTGNQISKIIEKQSEIFDFLSIEKQSSDVNSLKRKDVSLLLGTDKNTMSDYYFKIRTYIASVNLFTFQLDELRKQASFLIELIQNKYDLE